MTGNQHSESNKPEHCANDKSSDNKASEPTIIAEQDRQSPAGPKHIPADFTAASAPPAPPEQPANPRPSQQPEYPADPMDPSDPNSPNPIEGGREELFPAEPSRRQPPNE